MTIFVARACGFGFEPLAALILPGHADSPDLAWTKGPKRHALAVKLNTQQRVNGFRVGVEPFITAVEFCA